MLVPLTIVMTSLAGTHPGLSLRGRAGTTFGEKGCVKAQVMEATRMPLRGHREVRQQPTFRSKFRVGR